MKTLKLQVGKTYLNRNGEEVKITGCDGGYYQPYKGTNGEWYTESGRWQDFSVEDPRDLIEELPETRHTFSIPDGVKKVTVEQHGNRIVVEMVPEERKEPKPGDVMVNDGGSVYIFKEVYDDYTHNHYAWLGTNGRLTIDAICNPGRPATPEEAQPLFDALKKAGKKWNAEAMQVEMVPEIERIREWVWANLESDLYAKGDVAEAIEGYLKYREGGK